MDGNKVRLKPEAFLCGAYPELIDEVGTMAGVLDSDGNVVLNVHFSTSAKLVLLNVTASDFEVVD